uniref:Uncharacterized protein n=1 Tax=Micrurus carvalhoi TaxID=3147026 RepID=A0A2H6MZT0_9SAUR
MSPMEIDVHQLMPWPGIYFQPHEKLQLPCFVKKKKHLWNYSGPYIIMISIQIRWIFLVLSINAHQLEKKYSGIHPSSLATTTFRIKKKSSREVMRSFSLTLRSGCSGYHHQSYGLGCCAFHLGTTRSKCCSTIGSTAKSK